MAEHWAVEMAQALMGAANETSGGDGIMFAKISAVHPVTLLAHDQKITRHLYINAAYSPQAGDEVLALKSGVAFYILMKVVPI